MEVRSKILFAFLFLSQLGLTACSKKTSDSVFQEKSNYQSLDNYVCNSQVLMQNQFLVDWEDGSFSIENAENADQFTENFIKPNLDKIRHVEFDKVIRVFDNVSASTSEIDTLAFDDWGQTMVNAAAAWNQNVYGQGVNVAVVDAAVDYGHPQLNPRLAKNLAELNGVAGVDDDENGYIDDIYGWDVAGDRPTPPVSSSNIHGSHVAGIILADHSKGSVKGLAPKANLVPVNFMDSSGGGTIGAAIVAIKYAASRNVKVINASWGGPVCSESLRSAITQVGSQGILFVAASGNEYIDYDNSNDYMFPAIFNLANQITVAATTSNNYLTDFSNRSFSVVHIGAPGAGILSTVPGGQTMLDGTSMAAPFVSGAAALLWSDRPTATVAQIKSAILSTADVIPGKEYKVSTRGRLNIQKALDKIRTLVP